MEDFFKTVNSLALCKMSPAEMALGLDVHSKKYKLTSSGLEVLLNEQARREDEWAKKNGPPLGTLAEFASCNAFVHNLALITIAYVQGETQPQVQKRKRLTNPAPLVNTALWETSLFLWLNLVEAQILEKTLDSLSEDALEMFLKSLGQQILRDTTYLTQELTLDILLKIHSFYASKGKSSANLLSLVRKALPAAVLADVVKRGSRVLPAGDPHYRIWINDINKANLHVSTTAFDARMCDFDLVGTSRESDEPVGARSPGAHGTSFTRAAGYLDLCPEDIFVFLSNEVGSGHPDAYVRLKYGDIARAHFQYDNPADMSAAHKERSPSERAQADQKGVSRRAGVVCITIELAQPAELCRFFGLETTDARAIVRFQIPTHARLAAARLQPALNAHLQVEEEKVEMHETMPRQRLGSVQPQSREANEVAPTKSSSPPPLKFSRTSRSVSVSTAVAVASTSDLHVLKFAEPDIEPPAADRRKVEQKKALSERNLNLPAPQKVPSKPKMIADFGNMAGSMLRARMPSPEFLRKVPKESGPETSSGFEHAPAPYPSGTARANPRKERMLEQKILEGRFAMDTEYARPEPEPTPEWYTLSPKLSTAVAGSDTPHEETADLLPPRLRTQHESLHMFDLQTRSPSLSSLAAPSLPSAWSRPSSSIPASERHDARTYPGGIGEDTEDVNNADELETQIRQLVEQCLALREKEQTAALRREQDHARARASEQMQGKCLECKAC